MRSYFFIFTSAFCFSFGLTPLVRAQALRWGIVDHPNEERRIHKRITPRWGGIAIFCAFCLTLAGATFLRTGLGEGLNSNMASLLSVLAPATLIFLLGVWDDWRGLSAPFKFSIQVVAATMLYGAGWRIHTLSLPFDGQWDLPHWLGFPITIIWVLLITNAFNLIDGIDGLATGASSFALLYLFVSALLAGNGLVASLSLILLGAALGFLPYNFNPATIFLGDTGSLLLGFMAAALSLMSAQKSSTLVAIAIPLVSFGLPLTEVALSVARRYLSGMPLFRGDRGHIHHKLLDRGLSQRQVVILLYGVCAAFTFFGILMLRAHVSVIVLVFFILGLGMTVGVQRLGYVELNEFGAQLKNEVMRQPLAIRMRFQWRQRCRQLQTAHTVGELLLNLQELCAASECQHVQLEVFQSEGAETGNFALDRYPVLPHASTASMHSLAWTWQWQCEELQASISDAHHHTAWLLRLPLADDTARVLGTLTIFGKPEMLGQASEFVQLSEFLRVSLGSALSRVSNVQQDPSAGVTSNLRGQFIDAESFQATV